MFVLHEGTESIPLPKELTQRQSNPVILSLELELGNGTLNQEWRGETGLEAIFSHTHRVTKNRRIKQFYMYH